MTDHKAFTPVEFKLNETGEISLAFSRFNVIDSDADVTFPGALPVGKAVPMSAYGHTSWDGALPFGKGTIREQGDLGIFDGSFFMETDQGRNGYHTVKAMGDLQDWSYGYDVLPPSGPGIFNGQRVRELRKLDVYEVSPVLMGAGVNLGTLAMKSSKGVTSFADLPLAERLVNFADRPEAEPRIRAWASSDGSGDPDTLDWLKYRKGFLWYDAEAPEQLAAYKLIFADVLDGVLTAIPRGIFLAAATMQGARGGVDIPSSDRDPVKSHIARYYAKMRAAFDDDGIIPPWESKGVLGYGTSYADDLDWNVDEVKALFGRTEARIAFRAKEGRVMSAANMERLRAIHDAMDSMTGDLESMMADMAPLPKAATLAVMLATAKRLGVPI